MVSACLANTIQVCGTDMTKKVVVVAGDSWGCGEWKKEKHVPLNITHQGVAQYFRDAGYNVINLSCGGISLNETWMRLKFLFDGLTFYTADNSKKFTVHSNNYQDYTLEDIEHIIVFQTEWDRNLTDADALSGGLALKNLPFTEEMPGVIMSSWYTKLSELSQQFDKPIGIIGGLSDTMNFDNIGEYYPGLYILCQSFVNLIFNDEHQVADPCYSTGIHCMEFLKNATTNLQQLEQLIAIADKGLDRLNLFKNHADIFPDLGHPSKECHKKLYDFIIDNQRLR